MTIITRFSITLATALICTLFSITQAQTPRMATVNITPDADKVSIAAVGDVYEMRIEVSDESGDVVFQSGQMTAQALDWNMKDKQGERVLAGTYLVTVTYHNAAGKLKKRVEQVTVDEVEKASTVSPAAPQATPTPVPVKTTGTVTAGRIPKFVNIGMSAATVTNSILTESAGKIGLGNAAPKHTLSILNGPTWTANQWRGAIELGNATAIGWQKNSANWRFGMGHSNDGLAIFRTKADPGTQTTNGAFYDFFIGNDGNVSIGTITPTGDKLHVEGGDIGIRGLATTEHGNGVIGEANSGANAVGVLGKSSSGYAGFFQGKVRVDGHLDVFSCTGCDEPSDRNLKANFSVVNPRFILDRLSTIPIQSWNYKSESDAVRHIGPMAQDFRAAFGLGTDDKTLHTVDAQGVTMAALQGLYQMMQEKEKQNEQLASEVQQLRAQVVRLQRAVRQQRKRRR